MRVKPQQSFPDPNATFPTTGSNTIWPIPSVWYVDKIMLVFYIAFQIFLYIVSPSSYNSNIGLSSLFTINTGLIHSYIDCLNTVSVCTHTPSMVSITTNAPSVTRRAAVTSDEKSTCPGESIKLNK